MNAAETQTGLAGCVLRLLHIDGMALAAQMDFRPNRLNVAVRRGKVIPILGVG